MGVDECSEYFIRVLLVRAGMCIPSPLFCLICYQGSYRGSVLGDVPLPLPLVNKIWFYTVGVV